MTISILVAAHGEHADGALCVRRTGRFDVEGARGVDHGARSWPTTVGVG